MTLTRPPASGSCSGALRAPRPSPASTAPTTRSSSRFVPRAARPPVQLRPSLPRKAQLCPAPPSPALAHVKKSFLLVPPKLSDTVSLSGSTLDLGRPLARLVLPPLGSEGWEGLRSYAPQSEHSPGPLVGQGGFLPSLSYLTEFSSLPRFAGGEKGGLEKLSLVPGVTYLVSGEPGVYGDSVMAMTHAY